MRVFRIVHSPEAPEIYPVPDPDRFAREITFRLSELGEDADIGTFQLADPTRGGADFYKVCESVLVFSKKVYLSDCGQNLDFSGNVHQSKFADGSDEELFFLNVTAAYNCLDIARTVFYAAGGREVVGADSGFGIKEPAFFPKLIGDSSIFKIPQMKTAIFVACDGGGEDFYSRYQDAGLRGLSFREVWSD